MPNPRSSHLVILADKLELIAPFCVADRSAILNLPCLVRKLRRHEFISREDDRPQFCCVLLSGFAMRHKTAGNGGRQIFSIDMRGDAVDLQNSMLGVADHNLEMLSAGDAAFIPVQAIKDITISHPKVGLALWCETLMEGAILREWTLNFGRRDARSRMAHLLCEMALRLPRESIDETIRYVLPMSQEELADALALTPIHVSRTLKSLAADKLIAREKRTITVLDWQHLAKLGDFDPAYLNLAKTTLPFPSGIPPKG